MHTFFEFIFHLVWNCHSSQVLPVSASGADALSTRYPQKRHGETR